MNEIKFSGRWQEDPCWQVDEPEKRKIDNQEWEKLNDYLISLIKWR